MSSSQSQEVCGKSGKKQLPERLREALKRQQMRDENERRPSPRRSHSIERRMVEDVLGEQQQQRPRTSSREDLLVHMATRLRRLEGAMQVLRKDLAAKEQRLEELRAENGLLRKGTDLADLASENKSLKRKIDDMETFLSDYGLVWVGSSSSSSGGGGGGGGTNQRDDDDDDGGKEAKKTKKTPKPDLSLLLHRLRELNTRHRDSGPEVVREGRKATFKRRPGVVVEVFGDGLVVQRQFRPHSSRAARAFVKDVLDGYFPSEFKKTHPDGVRFDVHDKSSQSHSAVFPVGGRRLSEEKNDAACPDDSDDSGSSASPVNNDDVPLQPLADEFLRKLPAAVISREGSVLHIREGVRQRLVAHSQPPTTQGALIQIRDDDGARMLLSMKPDDTVADLRAEIDKFRLRRDAYDIRTAFPARTYADDVSLANAGFVPNATVFLQRQQASSRSPRGRP